jgi:glutathione S-transferase
MNHERICLIGRNSSHFTRLPRIFAYELGVELDFEPVYDITSTEQSTFADNPTLRVPALRTPAGTWFGSLPICRELARRSQKDTPVLFAEDLIDPLASNTQEIITDMMSAEVTLIMARVSGVPADLPFLQKPKARLVASAAWLDRELPVVLASLPPHSLSFLEVSAFCLCTHLEFREVLSIQDRPNLLAFVQHFQARESAQKTPYFVDQKPA